jgi:hypothetical protein
MAISLKAEHLKRYRDIARLFWKYGRSDLIGKHLPVRPEGQEEGLGTQVV